MGLLFTCDCGRNFNNQSSLNAHQIAHKDRPSRYSKSRRKNPTTYNCKWCDKEMLYSSNKENKFCSNKCQGFWVWEYVTKPDVIKGNRRNAYSLKRYLVEIFGECCSECGQNSTWNNKPLTLQLDHIDGNSDNNLPNNIRLLCPNCHSQTETFGNAGKGNRYKKLSKRNKYLQEYKNGRLV